MFWAKPGTSLKRPAKHTDDDDDDTDKEEGGDGVCEFEEEEEDEGDEEENRPCLPLTKKPSQAKHVPVRPSQQLALPVNKMPFPRLGFVGSKGTMVSRPFQVRDAASAPLQM